MTQLQWKDHSDRYASAWHATGHYQYAVFRDSPYGEEVPLPWRVQFKHPQKGWQDVTPDHFATVDEGKNCAEDYDRNVITA
jgi:hypothetical protein